MVGLVLRFLTSHFGERRGEVMQTKKMMAMATAAWLFSGLVMFGAGVAVAQVVDTDGDGLADDVDNCPTVGNADQLNQDGDLLGDACDECVNSDLAATVIIDGCDSGVGNSLFSTGCSIADQLGACAVGAKNHGKYVSCVTKKTNNLKKAKVITGKQKGAIQRCAAQADIPS